MKIGLHGMSVGTIILAIEKFSSTSYYEYSYPHLNYYLLVLVVARVVVPL